MKTGDIIVFKTKFIWFNPLTWLSYLIRKIAKIKYNHTGIVIRIHNEYFLFEAVAKGFKAINVKEKLKDSHIKEFKILTANYNYDKDKMAVEAVSLLGTEYDYKGLFWNQLILNLTGTWVGRKENQQNKLYCYEAVFYLHRAIFTQWWKMKPENLFESKYFKILPDGNK